ncbi:hypothetical protein [Azovibrio restrictus]|uniref:hypothetical protein n=1 Tax=Azovibrio restrictus TaxID=146938 RepID=UPI0026EC31DD|nr:hypothetical protein [Azovibrio restrictus]MDD3482986.1 hypothetical protein [Azovibrio restrictus]
MKFIRVCFKSCVNDSKLFWIRPAMTTEAPPHLSPAAQREFFRSFRDVHFPRRAPQEFQVFSNGKLIDSFTADDLRTRAQSVLLSNLGRFLGYFGWCFVGLLLGVAGVLNVLALNGFRLVLERIAQ